MEIRDERRKKTPVGHIPAGTVFSIIGSEEFFYLKTNEATTGHRYNAVRLDGVLVRWDTDELVVPLDTQLVINR